ncbi:MAG: hypothetical protein K8F60_03610 [Melioribacteraceae bacterium]|nr:hypothetical protein [Melioribacteraceae bacterium]
MKKKTMVLDIWDILGFKSEDYDEIIQESGHNSQEVRATLGRLLEKEKIKLEISKKKELHEKFWSWLNENISKLNIDGGEIEESLQLAHNRLDTSKEIDFNELIADHRIGKLFEVFKNETDNEEKRKK